MRLLLVLAVVSVGAVGCTDGAGDVTANVGRAGAQIMGGYDDADDTGVMALSNAGRLCTGSLIAPNVLLTARHCVSASSSGATVSCGQTTFSGLEPAGSFFVSSAPELSAGNLGEFLVAEVVGLGGIPGVPASVDNDAPFCGNDMAIAILQENVPASVAVPYEPYLEGSLDVGLAYYIVGYGAVNGGGDESGKRRRRDDRAVVCDGEQACLALELGGVSDGEWSGDGGVCPGDSGGPALDLQGRVIGVASRGDDSCEVSVHANPSAHAQWIKDTTVFASGMGLYEAPSWTAGATVIPEHSMPVGERCEDDPECPSGICVKDAQGQYCSRPCNEDGPCPEGFECVGEDETICRVIRPPAPLVYKRGESEGCQMSPGRRLGRFAWPVPGLGLLLFVRRRRCA